MRWRHYSCALIVLFGSLVGVSRADITYSYETGTAFVDSSYNQAGVNTFTDQFTTGTFGGTTTSNIPVNTTNAWTAGVNWTNYGTVPAGTTNVANGTSYIASAGSKISIPIYLVETVNSNTTQGTLSSNTSLINMYFRGSSNFAGLASASFAVEQRGAPGSNVGATPTVSQILGGPVAVPNESTPSSIPNTAGWTFSANWASQGTSPVRSGQVRGGSNAAQLYSNLPDSTPGSANGNNLQVSTHLNASSINGFSSTNGVLTDAPFNSGLNAYQTGKILLGVMTMTVGTGYTNFKLSTAGNANLTVPANATFDGALISFINNSGNPRTGPTSLSGVDGNQVTISDTILVNNAFGTQLNVNGTVFLDQSYLTDTRTHTNTYRTYTSLDRKNNGDLPIAGTGSSTGQASSYIPFYAASSTPFTFSVGSEAAPAVPEPSSMALCGLLTAIGAGYTVKRRRKAAAEAAAQAAAIA